MTQQFRSTLHFLILLVLLLLSLTTVYQAVATNNIAKWALYNPDALYLPALTGDILSGDYPLLGWKTPPAPYFFPDLMLYLPLHFLMGNLHVAIMLYGVLQSLLFVGGLMLLVTLIFGRRPDLDALLLALSSAFFLFLATGQCPAFLPIIQSGYHFGVLLQAVFGLCLIVKIITCQGSIACLCKYGAMFGIFAALTLFSDPTFLAQFLVPLMASALLLFAGNLISARTLFTIYVAILPGVPISAYATRAILVFRDFELDAHHTDLPDTLGNIRFALAEIMKWPADEWTSASYLPLFQTMWVVFLLTLLILLGRSCVERINTLRKSGTALIPLLVTIVLVGAGVFAMTQLPFLRMREWMIAAVGLPGALWLGYLSWHRESQNLQHDRDSSLSLLVLLYFVCTIVITVGGTLSFKGTVSRYFQPAIMFPLFFGWPFLFGHIPSLTAFARVLCKWWILPPAIVLLAFVTGAFPEAFNVRQLAKLRDYYPPIVECLDREAQNRQLQYGMAQYWWAKYLTLLSKHDLHVVQVFQGGYLPLMPQSWINNFNWFHHDFEFIMTEPQATAPYLPSENYIANVFGTPADTFLCEGAKFLVYNHPEQNAFREQFMPFFDFTAPASELLSAIGTVKGQSRVAEPPDPAGWLTYGPYRYFPIGDYAVTIQYSADMTDSVDVPGKISVGFWDVNFIRRETHQTLAKSKLPPAASGQITGTIRIRELGEIEVRTHYNGTGRLQVDTIHIQRIR